MRPGRGVLFFPATYCYFVAQQLRTLPAGVALNPTTGEITGPATWNAGYPAVIGGGSGAHAVHSVAAADGGTFIGTSGQGSVTFKGVAYPMSVGLAYGAYVAKTNSDQELEWFLPAYPAGDGQSSIDALYDVPGDGAVAKISFIGASLSLDGVFYDPPAAGFGSLLVKISDAGEVQWATELPYLANIVEKGDGTFLAAFIPYEDVTLGAFTLSENQLAAGYAKMGADGNWDWLTSVESTEDLAINYPPASGAAGYLVAGGFKDTLDIDGTTLTSAGDWDGVIALLDDSGNWDWILQQEGTGIDLSYPSSSYSDGGFLLMSESWYGTESVIDGVTLAATGVRTQHYLRVSNGGNVAWTTNLAYPTGVGAVMNMSPVEHYPGGDVLMAGKLERSSLTLGAHTINSGPIVYQGRPFLARLSGAGVGEWVTVIENDAYATINDVNITGGETYVSGAHLGTATFGAADITAGGMTQGYLAKLSAAGDWEWVAAGDGGYTEFATINVVGGQLALAGRQTSTSNFGDYEVVSNGWSTVQVMLNTDGTWPASTLAGWPAEIEVTAADASNPAGVTTTVTLDAVIRP